MITLSINGKACWNSNLRYDGFMTIEAQMSDSWDLCSAWLRIGITGHRDGNLSFAANQSAILDNLTAFFKHVDAATMGEQFCRKRLISPFAQGADLMAIECALALKWDVAAPIPFGFELNKAINGHCESSADILAILNGLEPADPKARASAAHFSNIAKDVRLFELAEQDDNLRQLYIETLRHPENQLAAQKFATITSERARAAAQIMIEQSDIIVAIWDGTTLGSLGGTHHTIATALHMGVPVLWIDARTPSLRFLLTKPEQLVTLHNLGDAVNHDQVEKFINDTVCAIIGGNEAKITALHSEKWPVRSKRRFHAYRRVEAIFSGNLKRTFSNIRQHYERPNAIASGSAAALMGSARNILGPNSIYLNQLENHILKPFAWADGLSSFLSDAYRGGMMTNFLLSAMAIIVGAAYLPLGNSSLKWPFAFAEFLLLMSILLITTVGRRRDWHGRWFQTRRVAEYLRHAPILMLTGVARPAGQWPRSKDTEWPEGYCRRLISTLGLPPVIVNQDYLRHMLGDVIAPHTVKQRQYHEKKAAQLSIVHHNLDKASEMSFILAVISVATYLAIVVGEQLDFLPHSVSYSSSKIFTFLGIAFPAIGGAFAGIRYFGDFERFAAISEITAERLSGLEQRIELLLSAPSGSIRYMNVAEIVHSIDDVIVSEIENWQAVFAGKQIAVPV